MLKLTDDDFKRLVEYMKKNYGINLEKKRVLIEGRLSNTIERRGFNSFKEFIDFAFADRTGGETIALVNKLTTNHTFFMREPEHFEYLKTVILPYIRDNNKTKDINIWCAASSTGQEPYTILMTILDFFGTQLPLWRITFQATDLDTDVLKKAIDGIYEEEGLKDVPKSWLMNYFTKLPGGMYQVNDKLRKMITFKKFNLMDSIPSGRPFDFISCRNVMIYFDTDTKNNLIERFYDVMKEGGYFYVGHAENVPKTSRFTYIKPAVYRRLAKKM
ncbi:MAG: protein-glutamate O-methyltransferase CheR [Ruminococcus sp.]|jgi:chemotaxis protein methyltransferase CheR|nr:protein-glutamate O-methyltransferase CheR [Ruminococcus sp.]